MPVSFPKHLHSKPALLRFGFSLILAGTVTLGLAYASYINYWKRTIFRTQTVDFNMLLNLLPTKLSIDLANADLEGLQQTLDSNYGLFGLVVTNCKTVLPDCPKQQIIHISNGTVVKSPNGKQSYRTKGSYAKGWQSSLSEQKLKGELYAVLRNPPPLVPEWEFKDPHAIKASPTGKTNPGTIIGRIYFLRNPPPVFIADIIKWLNNPLSTSSAVLLYNSILLATFLTSVLVWLILEYQFYQSERAKQRAVDAEKNVLIERAEKSEAQNQVLTAKQQAVEAEQRALKAENDKLRFRTLWEGFRERLDQDFASVLANRLEELRGFFRRLDTDVDNIVHDMRKAPLLITQGSLRDQIVNKLQQHFQDLNDQEKWRVIERTIDFITNTDRTIESVNWVLEDLRQIANIDATKISVQSTICRFLTNTPPFVNQTWLSLDFEDKTDHPLWILCNEWHLRSIIKNVLYNCCAALESYLVDQDIAGIEYYPKIIISCFEDTGNACIQIKDNGTGYPEELLGKLYQTQERISKNPRGGRGSIIVYAYLQLHHGQAILENLAEGGGQVTFIFPLVSPPLTDSEEEHDEVVATLR